jgi:hypothetical protein
MRLPAIIHLIGRRHTSPPNSIYPQPKLKDEFWSNLHTNPKSVIDKTVFYRTIIQVTRTFVVIKCFNSVSPYDDDVQTERSLLLLTLMQNQTQSGRQLCRILLSSKEKILEAPTPHILLGLWLL